MHIDEVTFILKCELCGKRKEIHIADPFYFSLIEDRLKDEILNDLWEIDEYNNLKCEVCRHEL